MTVTTARRLRPAAGLLFVVAAIVLLHHLGTGSLAAPPFASGPGRSAWLDARDPVTAGFALLRLAALVLAYHLAITSTVAASGHLLHRPGLVRAATAWTLPPFRSAVQRVVGLGLSATAALTTPVPAAVAAPPATATLAAGPGTATLRAAGPEVTVLAPRPDERTGVTLRLAPPPATTGTATLEVVAAPPEPPPPPPGSAAVPAEPGPPDPGATVEAPPVAGTHHVRPGDHLWRLAERRLALVLGRAPTDDEVAPYWRRIVEANPQLIDPDLLFPGDVVTLPAP